MERNQGPELSKEDLSDLTFGLLREWWIAATQALVDEAGSEAALRHLKPYFINTGIAGAHNIPTIIGMSPKEVLRRNIMGDVMKAIMGVRVERYRAQDGSAITDLEDCATKGMCKELCVSFCGYSGNAYHKELDPASPFSLAMSLYRGDSFCRWMICIEGQEPMESDSKEFLISVGDIPPLEDEMSDYLALSVLGESWSNATRAFMDFVGQERAIDRLCFYMRHAGLSFGIRMSDLFGARERGFQSILEIVELVQLLHHRKGICTRQEESAEGKVSECPFSSSPLEMCSQYEAFFNGICEAIDPNYEFVYDHMMTKGDKSCHWMIRKRGKALSASPDTTQSSENEDMLRSLKWRLIKGEISKEEYEELRNLVQE
jgi:hypothetical protein